MGLRLKELVKLLIFLFGIFISFKGTYKNYGAD